MAGFPIAWDDAAGDQCIPTARCPYAKEEVEDYLRTNHYHWCRDEPPSSFRASGPVLSRTEVGRNYWVYTARDDFERDWLVVIGSGQSPFKSGAKIWRWMYAERNDLE
jgi:hypothetical protein